MIISRTPFRISFFGGGTDYPAWLREHPGAVLVTTIDKYSWISCRYLPPFFEHRIRVVWSEVETVQEVSQIRHPVVREALRHLGMDQGLEIHHDGDLPARAGLGSSSSFTVGLLHSLHALRGRMSGKRELAAEAIRIEQERLRENVGAQDQVAAAFGGLNRIDFGPDGDFRVSPMILTRDRSELFQDHLLLFFTGFSRFGSEIAGDQIRAIPERTRELSSMYEMVSEGARILAAGDLSDFGRLLDEGWKLKRSLTARISTPQIDAIYESARRAGALGGKLLGAGGGGFMVFFAPPDAHPGIRKALAGLLHVPFRFERLGTQIVSYEPEEVPPPNGQERRRSP